MKRIVCAGFGGQGVLTAGLIISRTAMENGSQVTWIPSYGSEMRGGTANCAVVISDKKIASPFFRRSDILIALNRPSMAKFQEQVVSGGLVISNSSMVRDLLSRDDVRQIEVEATGMADELQNPRGANIVMLGALAAADDYFSKEVMGTGVESFFAAKGKNNPKNRDCFLGGYEAVKAYLQKGE